MTRSGLSCDVLVLGGGTAGCVLAARLSEEPDRSVCLVEGGPDYGAHDSGGWPPDMVDALAIPTTHDWADGDGSLPVARVIGGCSAHNLCLWVHPAADDWNDWAEATGDPAWSADGVAPVIRRVEERMPLHLPSGDEIDPWLRTLMEAAEEIGLGSGDDVNSLAEGVGPMPLNVRGIERWNAAFAYLDEARERPNLTILDHTLVDRVELDGNRAVGAVVHGPEGQTDLRAGRIVLCAGAYGSPAILMRSGIGPASELRRHGVELRSELPVGSRLRDHMNVRVRLSPSESMQRRIDEYGASRPAFVSHGLLKARSSLCPTVLWDLHGVILAVPASAAGYPGDGHVLGLSASLVKPAWTGTVTLRSKDPGDLPAVSALALADEGDMRAVLDGLAVCRQLAEADAARGAWTDELAPDPMLRDDPLRTWCADNVLPYFHPVGTCAMGREDDGVSTVDASGRVHGVDELFVADASVMPTIPRANTNLPTLVVAERIAERL